MNINANSFGDIYKKLHIDLDKLGCIMADVEPSDELKNTKVDESALYFAQNKSRKWINGYIADKGAHVTLLYGLLENGHKWKEYVDEVLKGWELKDVEIEDIGSFDSPYEDEPYYCIVAHVKITPELMEGHSRLQFLPHIDTFPGYKAHMTICYIKKDDQIKEQVIRFLQDLLIGKKLKVNPELNYGYKPGEE